MSSLRALTVHRPWSWAIAHGGKNLENRTWRPPAWLLGAYLAIHGGQKYDFEAATRLAEDGLLPDGPEAGKGIVAVCRVSHVFVGDGDQLAAAIGDEPATRAIGWWNGEAFGWVFTDVTPVGPYPCTGGQGLWYVPDPIVAQIRKEWAAAHGVKR